MFTAENMKSTPEATDSASSPSTTTMFLTYSGIGVSIFQRSPTASAYVLILKQRDKTLTDHTGGTKDADLQFFGHDDLYDLWVSMDYLRRTAVMRVAVKQCNCTKHAEQRQWSSQMVAAQ